MRNSIIALALLLAACATSTNDGGGVTSPATTPGAVRLTADPESRRAVLLTLTNNGNADAGYNLCTSALERRSGNEWVPVPLDVVCTLELRTLRPGQQDRYRYEIPRDLDPDDYRFVTGVEMTGERVPVASNSFRLR